MVLAYMQSAGEVDVSRTAKVILESDLNTRVFRALSDIYQGMRGEQDLGVLDALSYRINSEKIGARIGEHNLQEIEESLRSLSEVGLIYPASARPRQYVFPDELCYNPSAQAS